MHDGSPIQTCAPRPHAGSDRAMTTATEATSSVEDERLSLDSGDTLCQMTVQMHPRTVHVHVGLTPLTARRLNLTAVTDAFDAAGIDYFVVTGLDNRTSVVGVAADQREVVYKALGGLAGANAAYVEQILPVPPVRRTASRANSRATWSRISDATVIRYVFFRTEPARQLVFGPEYGCEVEFWERDDTRDVLISPRPNRVARMVTAHGPTVVVPGERFTRFTAPGSNALPSVHSRMDFAEPLPDDIDFPIDAVYTWVDHTDPVWAQRRAQASDSTYHAESASAARFISRDELRYSLRSLHLFAPWIRNIYVVTDDQTPDWLDTTQPNIKVVSHREIFADTSALPVFNSHAIESQLHHIDGLSEHFLYFNDDMFLGRPVEPQVFFLSNGMSKFFYSQSRVPIGPITELDTPVDAACKNNRALLRDRFGRTVTQTFWHVPYALQRSVMDDIERNFTAPYEATMRSKFRSLTDLAIPSALHHYYAYFTGRALPGSIRYGYIQLAVPDLAARLARALVRRDWDTLCLNDAYSSEEQIEAQNLILRPFLEAYFPVVSPHEKSLP